MKKLTEIANKYNCDKGTVAFEAHGYTEMYNDFISSTEKKTLLEIGIWKGDSLKMWHEYNPEMDVHGVDINPLTNYMNHKVSIHKGSQSDYGFLIDVVRQIGPIDYIIDDGSHRYEDIMASFVFLYHYLKPGGIYFIEDLHAPQAQRTKVIEDLIFRIGGRFFDIYCNDKLLILKK